MIVNRCILLLLALPLPMSAHSAQGDRPAGRSRVAKEG